MKVTLKEQVLFKQQSYGCLIICQINSLAIWPMDREVKFAPTHSLPINNGLVCQTKTAQKRLIRADIRERKAAYLHIREANLTQEYAKECGKS